jgi:hypothetical protein
MRERSKKYRLENPENPRYVKYMYYANALDDKTVEVLNNECSNLNIEAVNISISTSIVSPNRWIFPRPHLE